MRMATMLMHCVQGADERDATSVAAVTCDVPRAGAGKQLRIGIPKEYAADGLSPGANEARRVLCICDGLSVRPYVAQVQAWSRGAELLSNLGHAVVPVSVPHTKNALATYYILAPAEAAR